jgi:[ribosomal protein S18]-alanine N-acetyltransferase
MTITVAGVRPERRPPSPASLSLSALPDILLLEAVSGEVGWGETLWRETLDAEPCFGLREARRWVAVAALTLVADEASLLNIIVDPTCRRKGFGRSLLVHGLERMRRRGARRCFLEVRRSNAAAIALYHSLGFTVVGERRGYYRGRGGGEDALVMMCDWLP